MRAVWAALFSYSRAHSLRTTLTELRPARVEFFRPFDVHLKTYIWDRFDAIIDLLWLENTWAIFTWQWPFKDCLPAVGHYYLWIVIITWSWNYVPCPFHFPGLIWLWLTHCKVDSLFFKWFTFWLCILGNILWLDMVALIQMENINFLDHGCIIFIVRFSTLLIIGIVRFK